MCILVFTSTLAAQTFPTFSEQNPVATIDPDRMFARSDYGKTHRTIAEQWQADLRSEYRVTISGLEKEEQALTVARDTLSNEDFRIQAEAFDRKANTFREKQRADAKEFQQREQQARQNLNQAAEPIIRQLMNERGITLLLDVDVVFVASLDSDITDEIITRLNLANIPQ